MIKTVLLFSALIYTSYGQNDCPPSSECTGCGVVWIRPEISEEQTYIGEDQCTVTLTWNWPYNTSEVSSNPRLTFLCVYDDNHRCNIGEEETCASCESATLYRVHPSRNPVVQFTDTCGNAQQFPVAQNCGPGVSTVEPKTTTSQPEPTTSHSETTTADQQSTAASQPQTTGAGVQTTSAAPQSTVDQKTTVDSATSRDTTSSPPDVGTSIQPPLTTSDTPSGSYCPAASECTSCPDDWAMPEITESTVSVGDDSCDVTLSWDTSLTSGDGSPLISFTCYYGETGEYCSPNADILCASCGNITLYNISSVFHPYVTYTDNCGYSGQRIIASECYTPPEVTTPLPSNETCPNSLTCSGCDGDTWTSPKMNVTTGPLDDNRCDIYITWDWDYRPIEDYPNARYTFQCIYANGEFCDVDHFQAACGSCETIVFEGVDNDLDPYINFSNTCGDLFRLNVPDCRLN